jgi:hypothetical protein
VDVGKFGHLRWRANWIYLVANPAEKAAAALLMLQGAAA